MYEIRSSSRATQRAGPVDFPIFEIVAYAATEFAERTLCIARHLVLNTPMSTLPRHNSIARARGIREGNQVSHQTVADDGAADFRGVRQSRVDAG